MDKRKITKLNNLKFEPFDKYGDPIKGWSWHKISFDEKTNFGTYISKLEPGQFLKLDKNKQNRKLSSK